LIGELKPNRAGTTYLPKSIRNNIKKILFMVNGKIVILFDSETSYEEFVESVEEILKNIKTYFEE